MRRNLNPELYFEWTLSLKSTPEHLWPFIADTDRLNHDLGFSQIERLDDGEIINSRKRARQLITAGLVQEWTEEPFQWIRPYTYNTLRSYTRGIFKSIHQHLRMTPNARGGTDLHYEISVQPKNAFFAFFIRRSFAAMPFEQVFQQYDEMAFTQPQLKQVPPFITLAPQFADGGRVRLDALQDSLLTMDAPEAAAHKLIDHISTADDLSLMTIQPYALADLWALPRQDMLEACLIATRIGMLDMSWDLLCPNCRGAKATVKNLSEATQTVHCEVCHIDYTTNFERSVELIFTPNPSIRPVERYEYCVGGPEVTPHVMVQQLLQPGELRTLPINLQPGRYRVRTPSLLGSQFIRVAPGGKDLIRLRASQYGWDNDEPLLDEQAEITLTNNTDDEQLFIVEHLSWSDQSVTAADVITRQVFRDLFSSEALRPGEQVSVGTVTIVFTDLRGSTAMYRRLGDAPAFGLVMSHFDVLRAAIRADGGAIVKTIGDAVMAVFRTPEDAVRAMLTAHRKLSFAEDLDLTLRVGIHTGRCIAVNMNERLDYFGTTINMAARLEGLSAGGDIVMSNDVHADPAVIELLNQRSRELVSEPFTARLRGLDDDVFELWRVVPAGVPHAQENKNPIR